jgi:hypothetical protein
MTQASNAEKKQVIQRLTWGPHQYERASAPDTMFAHTGRSLYVLGDIDGQFRPRSNPYDLHAFGKPQPDDPLAEKLQGVWAQPVKGLSSFGYRIETDSSTWRLEEAETFAQAYAFVEFKYKQGFLTAIRRDFAAQDLPVLVSTLSLVNEGGTPLDLRLVFEVAFDLQDAWFTHLAESRNTGQEIRVEQGRLVARADLAPERWAVAAASHSPAREVAVTNPAGGQIILSLRIRPGETITRVFGAAIESRGGAQAAHAHLDLVFADPAAALAEKSAAFDRLLASGPRLESPEPFLNMAFDLARANLQMLEADTAGMGRYFYAGLEMFPFWFSCDGAYSLPGLLAGGFRETTLHHTRIGLEYLGEGRVPHQISPAGNIAFAGNAQETPLWVLSAWDAFRYTGDRDFLTAVYPGARKGMFEYVLTAIDPDGDGYPSGPGMVEVEGMGEEKLDTAAYTWAALKALARMAAELGDLENSESAEAHAKKIASRFDEDWWDEASGTYAMSLEGPGNTRRPVPHWAVIVPLEVGLASRQNAAATFDTLRAEYLNRWGLKHTVGNDERVWTLPTATLSRAAYRYGDHALGETMLRSLGETLHHGPIGLFHELIPEGACIIQLWSAATFLRGIIEDMLGLDVDAASHRLKVTPRLPAAWTGAALDSFAFGEHCIRAEYKPGQLTIYHTSGNEPLLVTVVFPSGSLGTAVVQPGAQEILRN